MVLLLIFNFILHVVGWEDRVVPRDPDARFRSTDDQFSFGQVFSILSSGRKVTGDYSNERCTSILIILLASSTSIISTHIHLCCHQRTESINQSINHIIAYIFLRLYPLGLDRLSVFSYFEASYSTCTLIRKWHTKMANMLLWKPSAQPLMEKHKRRDVSYLPAGL